LVDKIEAGQDLNGLWALRTLRQAGNTAAIFIISGNSEEQLKLDAFEGGADDYMVKPILVSEVKARIHRWLQRRNQFVSSEAPSSKLRAGCVKVDLLRHQVLINGNCVPATPEEGMVLVYLIRHAGWSRKPSLHRPYRVCIRDRNERRRGSH
jgi:two-component system, OmpR family, response regulator